MAMTAALLLAAALMLEWLAGYPAALQRRIAHPVVWCGWLIEKTEARFNRPEVSAAGRRVLGLLFILLLLASALFAGYLLTQLLAGVPGGWLLEVLLLSSLLAARSLERHVAAVARGLLLGGLSGGRTAVSRIVGRDPESLDGAGVCRAAVESLAENFSDGVVAPAFWYLLLGLPGALAYKALNTADSMIGHRDDRFLAFGWAAARLDDLANLLPARLSALLIAGGALLLEGASVSGALSAAGRDAGRHRSPNAGWPEAAMAGALGFRLAGPRRYGETLVEDSWMGSGRAALTADDIRRALALYRRALLVLFCSLLLLALL